MDLILSHQHAFLLHVLQEALNVYNQMVSHGHTANTTTYNALISAYSKAGRLEKVMETFQEMTSAGCERSVITYSAMISACEKAGQWQLSLDLFQEMQQERCTPNVITYNSLITACAQVGCCYKPLVLRTGQYPQHFFKITSEHQSNSSMSSHAVTQMQQEM